MLAATALEQVVLVLIVDRYENTPISPQRSMGAGIHVLRLVAPRRRRLLFRTKSRMMHGAFSCPKGKKHLIASPKVYTNLITTAKSLSLQRSSHGATHGAVAACRDPKDRKDSRDILSRSAFADALVTERLP